MLDEKMIETTAVEIAAEEKSTNEPLSLAVNPVDPIQPDEVQPNQTGLMRLAQVPVIIENLQSVKAGIEQRAKAATAMVCTESNYKEIKAVRTAMNKEFTEFEKKRMEIKKAVLSPYENLEAVYKECITAPYKTADTELKKKIAEVENSLKAEKEKKAREHFEKYAKTLGVDFVKFENAGCQVSMSISVKKLKEQCTAFLDRVMDDLQLIATQENTADILVEYKKSLNVSQAIRMVKERYEAIAAEKVKQEAEKAERERAAQNEDFNATAFEQFKANVPQEIDVPEGEMPEPVEAASVDAPKRFPLSFTIYGTREQLKAAAQYIKEYLNREGLRYE